MYEVTQGTQIKIAFTMRQALYYVTDFQRQQPTATNTTITLPDGTILAVDYKGDLSLAN